MGATRTEASSGTIVALVCALAIAAFPLFGYTEERNLIAQAISALALGVAILSLTKRIPSFHFAVLTFVALLAFWGLTVIRSPEVVGNYLRLLKMAALSLAAHIVFRTPKNLLLLFGVFGASGIFGAILNWGDLSNLSASLSGGEVLSDKSRFAGTFGNANGAGTYATTTLLVALIYFLNSRSWLRWLVLFSGSLGGIALVYFTGSRKAMLVLGLIALFVPALAIPKGASGKVKWLVWGLLSGITIFGFGLLLYKLPYTERLLVQIRDGIHAESSSDVRASMLTSAFELWTEHPFFGCGFEGFAIFSGFGVYSHSTFSEVLCNGGLFGFALLALFYFLPGIQIARLVVFRMHNAEHRLHIGLFALWAQFTFFSVFSVMWYTVENLAIYMAICGYLQESLMASRVPLPAAFPSPRTLTARMRTTNRLGRPS